MHISIRKYMGTYKVHRIGAPCSRWAFHTKIIRHQANIYFLKCKEYYLLIGIATKIKTGALSHNVQFIVLPGAG